MNDNIEEQKGSWKSYVFGKNPRRTLFRVCVWAVVVNLVFHSLLLPITVSGSSMFPTYKSGTKNLVNRLSYVRNAPNRGDVVVIRMRDGELLIKRIIGLPGESIQICRGKLLVNGSELRDRYSHDRIPWATQKVRLRSSEFFVIGDNRACSVFGRISKEQILGKVLF